MTLACAIALWAALGCAFGALSIRPPSKRQRAHADGLWEASLWIEDAMDHAWHETEGWRWLNGSRGFLRQLAREQAEHIDLIAPLAKGYRSRLPRRVFPS